MASENQSQSNNRGFDMAINAVGVLAILLMGAAVLSQYVPALGKVITPQIADYLKTGGWVAIGLYILGIAFQSRDWLMASAKNQRTQSGGNLLLQVILSLAIIGSINWFGTRHHKRWDLTENKQFSLSDQSKKVVKDLPGKVNVTMFVSPNDRGSAANKDLWEEYAYVDANKIKFKAIDPDRDPKEAIKFLQSLPQDQRAKIFEGDRVKPGTIVLEYASKVTPITGYNEQDFTSALIKSTRANQKTIYFVEGHGEADPEGFGPEGMGQVKQSLEKQNYKIDKLPLFGRRDVPADAAAVVIAGPQKALDQVEIGMLTAYVKHGGKVMVLFRPGVTSGLEKWMSDNYSVTPDPDIVLEMDPRYTLNYNPTNPAVVKYPFHTITQSFQNFKLATVFPLSRSFKVSDKKPENVQVEPLAETTEKAEGRILSGPELAAKDLERPYDATKDLKGPLKLAVAITLTTKATPSTEPVATGSPEQPKEYKGRIVAIGSGIFAINSLQRMANGDFFLAGLNWLAEEEALISIPPKSNETRTVELIGGTQRNLGIGTVLFPPIALLLIGIAVWWRRR